MSKKDQTKENSATAMDNEGSINVSRRTFLGAGAAAVGVTAITAGARASSMGEPPVVNLPTIKDDEFSSDIVETDVLVIGSGIAGLFAAIKAHDTGAKVIMVSKGRLGSSGMTPFGKGVFSYDKNNRKMSEADYLKKVATSAIGTNNPVFTKLLLEHSYDRVQELKSWGFFDSPLCFDSFSKPMTERNIPIHERIMMTHLHKEQGRVVGASGFSVAENKIVHYSAKSVILCTGAGAFKPNGFPMCDLTHDGSIMAYNIGAKITGKEWADGHPASATHSGSSYDNWHGQVEEKPSVEGPEIHHDLGVDLNYKAYIQGGPVSMGPSRPGSNDEAISGGPWVPNEFQRAGGPPHGDDKGGRPSGPPGKEPPSGLNAIWVKLTGQEQSKPQGPPNMMGESVGGSTAGMSIHKSEGLVPIDANGLSTIPGLWASGDALGSHQTGGIYTQIGSSMAGSAVQGALAGEAAGKASQRIDTLAIPADKLTQTKNDILAPLRRTKGYKPAWVTQVLQSVMIPNFVLYIKKERMMDAALAYVEELRDHHVPMLVATDRHHLRLAHETANMVISAEMKMKASMMRKESRCSHYRLDYPEIDYDNWNAWITIHKDDKGQMVLEKQDWDKWPRFS